MWALFVNAQTPQPSEGALPITYKIIHDHAIGQGQGELSIIERGIEFKGEGKGEDRHSRNWRADHIKRLAITRDELRVTVYEAAGLPIIPRKVPVTDGKAVRQGTEHDYGFRLHEGAIMPEVAQALFARFHRPIATSVIPNDEAKTSNLLFEIPVFHRNRAGGKSGMLRVYP